MSRGACQLLCEYANCAGADLAADAEAAVIRGVKVLSPASQNGRVYRLEALRRALALYEGAKVNVNHPKGHPAAPRDYQDRIGVLRSPRLSEQGIFADLHYNPRHPLAGQLAWDARHAPGNLGLSHNVEALVSREGEALLVHEIVKVHSVDLVADPAATRGLFENSLGRMEDWPCRRTECASSPQLPSFFFPAHEPSQEKPAMPETPLEENRQEPHGGPHTGEPQAQPPAAPGAERARLAELEEQVRQLLAEKARLARREAVELALREARLPAELVSQGFRQMCHAADDETLAALLADRRQLAALLAEQVRAALASGRPLSREQQLAAVPGQLPCDGKSLAALVT